MGHEILTPHEIPYRPFPANPERINILGFEVLNYIPEHDMDMYIEALSERVKLRDYDTALVNLWGALELFKDFRQLQNYRKWPEMPKIARGDVSGVIEIFPTLDPYLKRKKVLIVEDVYDRGYTMQELFRRVGPESRAVVAAWKIGVPGQVYDPRVDAAVKVDNKWLGGKGMDIGFAGEGQIFRQYRGLVVKP